MNKLLYIHIPFCDSKCHYCAFNSFVDKNHLKKQYESAILKDIEYQFKKFDIQKKSFSSLFIGGGTPSVFPLSSYEKIFSLVMPYLSDNIEITTEANPSLKKEWIEGMKSFGVNRFSLGVQSFNDEKLKFLGRNHSNKKAIKAIENIYDCGVDNISIDLIYDTSLDNKEILKQDIDIVSKLPINNLSSYSLTIEENTKFFNMQNTKLNNENLAMWWIDKIKENGFFQYEISSFSKDDKYKSKHNRGYWSHYDYIGIGCGAVGCTENIRYYMQEDIHKYISNPYEFEVENLSYDDIKLERIFLGLRSEIGVDIDIFNKYQKEKIQYLIKEHKIFSRDNKIFNKNYLISDELVTYIYE